MSPMRLFASDGPDGGGRPDTTRPHPRQREASPAGTRIALTVGTLYVSPAFDPEREARLLAHFHGAAWLVEGTYASTTEPADHLLMSRGAPRLAVARPGPIGMQQLSVAERGGFWLAGFAGNSAPDHLDHLYALGDALVCSLGGSP